MKKKKTSNNSYRYFLSVIAIGSIGSLQANPENLRVVSGEVSKFNPATNILEITSGKKAIIEWDSFSIANHEITRFIQQDSSSSVLNRVTGDMSQILGTLESNGKVFLINPSGIIIGEGARIDTGSFIASTFDILNADFLEGENLLFSGDSEHDIVNLGTIRALEGDVILIAHRIKNDGTIHAPKGTVHSAVGHEVLLQTNESKISIKPGKKITFSDENDPAIKNNGTINALAAELKTSENIYGFAIKGTGTIEATGVLEKDGRVLLVAEKGRIDISGTIIAKNQERGGTIHVIGDEVGVTEKGLLDASGNYGGGEILVGGDRKGENPNIPNASLAYLGPDALFKADCMIDGEGGKVIFYSDKIAGFYGNISAKAGPLGGDGGFVEVSGKQYLDLKGFVDLGFALGKPGTYLIDPINVTISTATSSPCVNFTSVPSGSSIITSICGSPTNINFVDLNNQLNASNGTIIIDATVGEGGDGTITVQQGTVLTDIVDWSSPAKLVFNASSDISLFSSVQNTFQVGESLTFNTPGDLIIGSTSGNPPAGRVQVIAANIDVNCANLFIIGSDNNPNNFSTLSSSLGNLTIHTNNITLQNTGDIIGKNLNIVATGDITLTPTPLDTFIQTSGGISEITCNNLTIANPNLPPRPATPFRGNIFTAGTTVINAANISLQAGDNANIINTAVAINNTGNLTINCANLELSPGSISGNTATITNSANLTINASSTILFESGKGVSTNSQLSSTAGNVSLSASNLTLTNEINANASSSSSISINNSSLTFNVGTLTIESVGDMQSFITTANGTIGGNVGNLLIETLGSQNAFISATGTGSISLTSPLANGSYILTSTGSGAPSISSVSGTISFAFNGTSSGLSLIGGTSPAQIIRTGGTPGNIQVSGTASGNYLLINGVSGAPSPATIVNHFGDIDVNFAGPASVILLGETTNSSFSLLQTTLNPGNINITQNNGMFVLQGGNGTSSQAAIESTGQINITGSGCTMNLFGGSGSGNSQAFIQSTGNTTINIGNLLLLGGTGVNSDAFIMPLSTGNVSINTPNVKLEGSQTGTGSGNAYISNPGSTLGITSSVMLDLIGGSSATNTAFITATNNINLSLGGLLMLGGSGSNAAVSITSTAGAIQLTGIGTNDLVVQGSDGANSSATITTPSSITINAPNQNLLLKGGQGVDAVSSIISTGSPGPITIECANLSLIGSATGSGGGFASIATNVGDISIDAKGFILLEAGNVTNTYAQITSNQGNINIGQNIPSFGNLSLYAGDGTNSYARIFTSQGNILIGQTARSFGDLSLFGGNGSGAYAQIATIHGNIVTVNSGGNVILKGGNSPAGGISYASISGVANFVGGSLSLAVTGNSLSLEGGTGAGAGSNQAYILADVSGSGNTVNITISDAISLIAGDGFGTTNAFIRSQSGGGNNVTINCANLSLQGSENPLTPSGFASITSATGTTTINSSGSISLIGGASEIGSSYALIDVEFHGIVAINAANNIHIEGGFGLDSNAEITSNSIAGASGSISITSNSLQLIGGGSPVNGLGQANIAILNDVGNITINCQSAPGFIILQGGTGAGNNSVSIQADNGSITMSGSTLSVIGGDGTGNANASIFTSSASNPILLNFSGDVNISGAQSPYSANGLSNASITTSSTGAASPITITSANLSLLGSPSGSGQGSASIVTNVGGVSITSTGNLQLISGNAPVSFTKIQTTEGAITLSASGNVHLQGGTGTTSQSQIIRLGSTGDTTITSGSLILSGGVGSSSFAQIGTNVPNAFPFTGNISFPSVSGDVTVSGGHNEGYALIGHGSPSASTTGIHFTGNITFSSVAGNVYVSGGIQEPSFGQIGHVNSTSNSSTLSGNITITGARDVTVVNGGAPGYALIGMGGQSNTSVDSFTSDISITANNVSLQSQGLSEFTVGGYSVIGFLSPGSGIVTIHSTNLNIQTTQDISRLANTPTIQPVAGIGSYVLSTSNASSATITNLTLNPRLNFRFTLDNSPSQYSDGIDFVGTYFSQNSLATGSSSITITAGRNFFFDEYMLGLANQGFLQNTNPNNITSHLPIEITVGNGFYTSKGAGNTMSVISSGTLSINDPSNPQGDVMISNLTQSYSGMEIIAGMNLILGNFAILNNTTSGNINLVADNLDPTAPDFNPAYGFTLITPATVTNQNNTGKIFIYSTTEFSTFIGNGQTPSINGNVFVHGSELVDTPTEAWGVYFPSGTLTTSSYRVFYKNLSPTPHPPGPTPSQIAFLKILSFDHYKGNFLISQMLYPQPEILDDYMFWAEAFSTAYDMKKYEKVRKSWGYRSSYDVFQKRKYILNRNKYFDFYELMIQRDLENDSK